MRKVKQTTHLTGYNDSINKYLGEDEMTYVPITFEGMLSYLYNKSERETCMNSINDCKRANYTKEEA